MARPKSDKKMAKMEFFVEENLKKLFMELCEQAGATPTKVLRRLFNEQLEKLKGGSNGI